jgi:sulfur carrier protein
MKIKINGKQEAVDNAACLSELISSKGLCAEKIVVEYNANILPKEKWGEVTLCENDIIEIISFVGGG